MPAAKATTKQSTATTKGKKAAKGNVKPSTATRKALDDTEYMEEAEGEDQEVESSSDSNDADVELFRAAFASAKSKNAKKKNTEFLKKNQDLINEAREQAEAMKLAGEMHLDQLAKQFEVISQPSGDLLPFTLLVGDRTKTADTLIDKSSLSLEQITADYEEVIRAADEEFQMRAARREKVRRHTMYQAQQILERGVEEQKLITDATDFIKSFQRLMSL